MLDADISTADALALLHTAETDPWAVDRRRFLQLVGMGVGAGLVSGPGSTLLGQLGLGHDPSAWAAGPVGATDGILVVIGMFGGNDGLNSVVPYNDGNYYTQHGSLAIPGNQTLPLANGLGLNPALTTLKQFWDAGELAVVQGIGYPNPDFSHFNSMAYWMAGRIGIPTSGWLGRWLDGYLGGGRDLYAAAEVGYSVPLHLVGNNHRGTVVPANRPGFGASADADDQRMYQAIRSMSGSAVGTWQSSVSQAFIDQLDLAATLSSHYPADDALPDSEIVARLEIAARMINANLGFRVLTVGWGDFDSHANQPGMHTERMQELNEGIARFFQILGTGWRTRVTIMTFSEFGRTSWDNDGQGTDHGSAAPHFVIGANVKGGLYGATPSLAGLDRWERMPHTVDFRSYYASVIDGWLGGGSTDVLGGTYENLGLFARGPGLLPNGQPSLPPAVLGPASCFVPIAPMRVIDTRDGTGGVINRPINPNETISVPIAGQPGIPASGVTAVVANVTATQSSNPNFFTVFPSGTAPPTTSNLNVMPGLTVPNLVVMGLGTNGAIDVLNAHGTSHCIIDVFGYFTESTGDGFVALEPSRLFDTRTGQGVRPGKLIADTPVDVQVAGLAGVPGSGATAVAINLTATEPEDYGWVRATPSGRTPAVTSNLNFRPGDTVPNMVICMLGDGGRITLDTHCRATHVLGDVFGYFTASGRKLRTLPPNRLLDTRNGTGAPVGPLAPRVPLRLGIRGSGGVPDAADSVVLNVTATNVTGPSFVTVWPDGGDQPDTSNLNVRAGQTVANLVICRLGDEGALRFATEHAGCDLIADVLGYFTS